MARFVSAEPDVAQFDDLVIGAGSAGCAVAARLSSDPTRRVLVVEAGGQNRSWKVRVPAAQTKLVLDPRYDWCYRTEPDPSREGRVDLCYRGKGLGGSSAINGMVYVRGAPADYNRWAAAGAEGWSWADVEPVFRDLEAPRHAPERGSGGPLRTRVVQRPHPTTTAFLEACAASGWPRLADYNAGVQLGVGAVELNQRHGQRWSSADAFLTPALSRANLSVWTDGEVLKLDIEEGRVCGALVRRAGTLQRVRAQRTVLCAGTINTPKLLMLSGVGDARRLAACGVRPVVDRPAVGKGLREHPMVRLVYETQVPTFNDATSPWRAAAHLWDFVVQGEGPISSVFQAVGFVKSRPDLAAPDLQLHFLPLALALDDEGKLALSHRSGVTIYVNATHPESVGEVDIVSNDPAVAPRVAQRLLDASADLERLVRGLGVVQDIARQPPLARLITREVMPGFSAGEAAGDKAAQYVRRYAEPAYHPVGTCRMGRDEAAVVTPRLEVRGVKGLWIADASIMPDLISGNTNAACMMIGDRLGRWLRAETRYAAAS